MVALGFRVKTLDFGFMAFARLAIRPGGGLGGAASVSFNLRVSAFKVHSREIWVLGLRG